MAFAWMRVKNWSGNGDIDRFRIDFKLAAADVDDDFGLIGDGPGNYTAMIAEGQVDRLKQDYPGQFEGPFSDPPFAHFMPPHMQ